MRFLAMKLQPQLLSTTTIKRCYRHVVTKQGGLSQVSHPQPPCLPHPRSHCRRVFQANSIGADGNDHSFFAREREGSGEEKPFFCCFGGFWERDESF
ncbi:hypothetical protein QJS04_geneDACA003393 [Acorus gramineus]|uniref:Uncharacterized protein n=1 Tax=Acorus gramineus TaxID=55184 RepID=A0AAV9BSE9_ACOGR|nr:hypothetical protein QJS04_geneDACA003393 [Acorus gramineus]